MTDGLSAADVMALTKDGEGIKGCRYVARLGRSIKRRTPKSC